MSRQEYKQYLNSMPQLSQTGPWWKKAFLAECSWWKGRQVEGYIRKLSGKSEVEPWRWEVDICIIWLVLCNKPPLNLVAKCNNNIYSWFCESSGQFFWSRAICPELGKLDWPFLHIEIITSITTVIPCGLSSSRISHGLLMGRKPWGSPPERHEKAYILSIY